MLSGFATRVIANSADQGEFWPYGASDPDYLVFCIEGGREEIDGAGTLNPRCKRLISTPAT